MKLNVAIIFCLFFPSYRVAWKRIFHKLQQRPELFLIFTVFIVI